MTHPLTAALTAVVADAGVFCSDTYCRESDSACTSCVAERDPVVADLIAAVTAHAEVNRREVIEISGYRLDVIDASAFPSSGF